LSVQSSLEIKFVFFLLILVAFNWFLIINVPKMHFAERRVSYRPSKINELEFLGVYGRQVIFSLN